MLKKTTFIEQSFYDELTAEEQRDALKIAEDCWKTYGSLIQPSPARFYSTSCTNEHNNYIVGKDYVAHIPVGHTEGLVVFPFEYVERLFGSPNGFTYFLSVGMLLGERRVHWAYHAECFRGKHKGLRFGTLPYPNIFVFEPIQEQAED